MTSTNKFNLSHDKLLSCNMGQLIPLKPIEVLPKDTFQHSTSALVRAAPLMAPTMTPTHMMVHQFFVPVRLVWDEWEEFITGGEDGLAEPVYPTIKAPADGGFPIGSLADYLGLPTGKPNIEVSAIPFRMMALIYNEYFRDQDLEPKLVISKASGLDTTTVTALQTVAWGKDYFTTSRPTPQKGPDVFIPLGTSAPVVTNNLNPVFSQVNNSGPTNRSLQGNNGESRLIASGAAFAGAQPLKFGDETGLRVDLTAASAVSIEDLRFASALQRYYETMSQFGSRYVEYLRTIFGVKSSDARLQRPEYLSGGINTLQFSEVLQTAEGDSPVGEMRGHGIGVVKSNRYRRFFEEHGYVFTLISVKPTSIYMDGIDRTWNRRSKEDYYVPHFANLGQQEVLNKEVFADGTPADDNTFGFQDRYDEYRSVSSSISGEFRDTLDFWHLGRKFASRPALNASFIKSNPSDRIFAVPASNQLYMMIRQTVHARRPILSRSNPLLK